MGIKWEDKYSVGESQIDAQHKRLFTLINDMETLYLNNKGNLVNKLKEILNMIDELGDYAVTHFYQEEMGMENCGCPDLEEHKLKHEAFVEEINNLKDILTTDHTFKKDEKRLDEIVGRLYTFLTNWLTNHILIIDMKYKDKIKEL